MSTTLVQNEVRRKARLMGSAFEFIVVDNAGRGEEAIDAAIEEVKRIEYLLTEFSDTSVTSQINRLAWQYRLAIDPEVYNILKRCHSISEITQGSFDITSGVLKKLYNFKGAGFKMPDSKRIANAIEKVGYDKIKFFNNNRIQLATHGMHIAFGAIGKGYAADMARKLLMQRGIGAGVINASGDLTVWGTRADGSSWKVGIADPQSPSQSIAWIPLDNGSVATSGNYEQFFEYEGVRYSHNIDPRSGLPVKGIKSATVVSASAELSDALATAVTVMGVEVGLHFIQQLPATHCLIIDDNNRVFASKNLRFTTSSAL